jgi:hydrogenase-4 component F
MGLAPMHNWLPDAHSEAPSLVSALLSGALLNCAFLGILRGQQVCIAAGLADFGRGALLALGLASLLVGAIFILRQPDYKRMLAYSSVEHMGILALGAGIGGAGIFGAFFHAINHALTKSALFQVSGNVFSSYGSKSTSRVRGLLGRLPASGCLWVAGFLAISGSLPFGTFWSKFLIFKAAFDSGQWLLAAIALLLLGVIFVSLSALVLSMAQGEANAPEQRPGRTEDWVSVGPALVLLLVVLLLGFYLPPVLAGVLHEAAADMGG